MVRVMTFALLCLFIASCDNDRKTGEKDTGITDGIRRYEVDLFTIDTNNFEQGIAAIYPKYTVFLGSNIPDENGMRQLRNFVTDTMLRSTYEYTITKFPDLQWLNDRFKKAFLNYQKALPGTKVPVVYTYISGFDIRTPVKYADSALIIGIDLYLGSDFKPYRELGYPLYIINRLTPDYILSDCFKEMAWAELPPVNASTLLDAMIEQGKLIYFAEVMLPEEKPEFLMKYTKDQLNWVVSNEQNLWSFIIQNQLLYSTDGKAITMFMTDGPFTSGFSDKSPSRTGHWLGWQIVRNYMKKKGVSMEDLLKDTDSQKILQESGYKPSRN